MHGNYSSSGTGDLTHHLQHQLWENLPLMFNVSLCPSSRPSPQLSPAPAECLLGSGAGLGPRRVGFLSSPKVLRLEGVWVAASVGGRGWGKGEVMPVVKGLLAEVWRVGQREGCG